MDLIGSEFIVFLWNKFMMKHLGFNHFDTHTFILEVIAFRNILNKFFGAVESEPISHTYVVKINVFERY